MDDKNNAENEVKVAQDFVNFPEFDSGHKVGQEKVQYDEMEVEMSAVSCAETGASELDSESSADGGVIGNGLNEEDTVDEFSKEDTVTIEQHMLVSHQNLFYVRETRKLENVTGTVHRQYFFMKIKLGINGFHIR